MTSTTRHMSRRQAADAIGVRVVISARSRIDVYTTENIGGRES